MSIKNERTKSRSFCFILIMLMFALTLLAAIFWVWTGHAQPDWHMTLNRYVEHQRVDAGRVWMLKKAVHAHSPYNFYAGLSGSVWGEGFYFQLDHPYSGLNSSRPLPYPPDDLWCALLEKKSGATPAVRERKTVFIALHQDLYMAEWVVHEIGDDPHAPEFPEILSGLGCTNLLRYLEQGRPEARLGPAAQGVMRCDF